MRKMALGVSAFALMNIGFMQAVVLAAMPGHVT